MSISINLQVTGIDKVRASLQKLAAGQIKQAASNALNDTAFHARKAVQASMASVFDQPSPYIVKSVQVKKASPERLEAWAGPMTLGGKGTDPQKILMAHVTGGSRRMKPFERALQTSGILPSGHFVVIPSSPYPGSSDGRGGLKVGFVKSLLTTMLGTPKNRGGQGKRTAKHRGSGRDRTGAGVFFVSDGSRLMPGIWVRPSGQGSRPRPVLLFVKGNAYSKRMDMADIAKQADLQSFFEKKFRYHIRKQAGE